MTKVISICPSTCLRPYVSSGTVRFFLKFDMADIYWPIPIFGHIDSLVLKSQVDFFILYHKLSIKLYKHRTNNLNNLQRTPFVNFKPFLAENSLVMRKTHYAGDLLHMANCVYIASPWPLQHEASTAIQQCVHVSNWQRGHQFRPYL